jgi:hypothetical protein
MVKNDISNTKIGYIKRFSITKSFVDNKDFKIHELTIDIIFKKYNRNVCTGIVNQKDVIFDESGFMCYPYMKLEIYFDDIDIDFEKYIKSVLLHEMTHIYQVYRMGGDKKIDSNWNLGSTIAASRSHINNIYVKDLANILYKASEHEIMSQLHQYFLYKTEYGEQYQHIFDIQKSLSEFDTSKYIIDDNFINDLNIFRYIHNKRLDINKPNNKYYRNVSFVWKREITFDNVQKFLKYVEEFVKKSLLFLNKKIKHVDAKCEIMLEGYDTFGYMRYIHFLSEI